MSPEVVGRGLERGYLTPDEVRAVAHDGLARLGVDGRRVLVLIPDGTRTMPMPLLFDVLEQAAGARVSPRSTSWSPSARTLRWTTPSSRPCSVAPSSPVVPARSRVFNHHWDDPASFATLGTIPAA